MSKSKVEYTSLLQFLRLRKGISQRTLSLALGHSSSYISKVESGENKPSVENFAEILVELDANDAEIASIIRILGSKEQS